jgi:polar amino acid transport system substrate-binding protein
MIVQAATATEGEEEVSGVIMPHRLTRIAVAVTWAVFGVTAVGCSSAKALNFCTDPNYAPAEFSRVTKVGTGELKRELAGADIDIARALAADLGASAQFTETSFSGIFDALRDRRCDAVISMANDTPERRQRVAFVDYLAAGQSVMARKDVPAISTVADLRGKTVAVARDTTEEQFLTAQNASASGGASIKILSFATENDAIYAVQQDAAQVYFGDTPVVVAAVAADKALVLGPEIVKPIPIGIALRPNDSLIGDLTTAVKKLYANGTMGQILARWNFTRYALAP